MRVVLATHSPHEVAGFQPIVQQARPGLEVVGYDGPEPVEDGVTFAENALLKARAAAAHTGLAALADDSGICVDVLGGSPGVFSAYWAGQKKDATANLELLLDQLRDIADPHRSAHFTSTIALVLPDGREHVVEGIWPGRLAHEAVSATTRSSSRAASPTARSAPWGSSRRRRSSRSRIAPAPSRRSCRCSPRSEDPAEEPLLTVRIVTVPD